MTANQPRRHHLKLDPSKLKDELVIARHKLGLSQVKLGEKLDLSPRTIGRMEKGELVIDKRMLAAMKWLLHEAGIYDL